MSDSEPVPIHVVHVRHDDDSVDLAAAFRDNDAIAVQAVADVATALDRIDAEDVDCVVSAHDLDGTDGIEFLRAVREGYPDLPFVLMPRDGSEELASEAIATGATDYLPRGIAVEGDRRLGNRIADAVWRHHDAEAEASRARFRALAEGLNHAIIAIDKESTIRFANQAVEDVFGYPPEEVSGESLTLLMPERLRQRHRNGLERYRHTGERHLDWRSVEFAGLHRDGHELSLDITFCEYEHGNEELYIGIVRDITDREHRTGRLRTLQEATQYLMEAEDRSSICDVAFMTARDVLDFPITGVWLYDNTDASLHPVAHPRHVEEIVGEMPIYSGGDSLAWEAFAAGETRVYEDVRTESNVYDPDTSVRSEIVVPLGDHGVITHSARSVGAFSATDAHLAELLAASTEAALDRAEREREIARQRDELETLNRLNTLIQEIIQSLMETTALEEIERTVCERLVASDRYRCAWIGDVPGSNGGIEPQEWAGIDAKHLDGARVPIGDEVQRAGERAIETGAIRVVDDPDGSSLALSDPDAEGTCRSIAVVPLGHEDTTDAVLVVYADTPDAFSMRKRPGFELLGDVIGFAINAIRNRKLLLSNTAVELEFRVTDPDAFFVSLSERLECQCTLDGIVPSEDALLHYVSIEGASSDRVLDVATDTTGVERARLVSEDIDGDAFEFAIVDGFCKTLIDAGGTVRSVTGKYGELRIVADAADNTDARSIVTALEMARWDTELLAKRTVERSAETVTDSRQRVADRLTERQRQVLWTAYSAGYFDWPRGSTAEEVAESIGVTPPTFHDHLRKAQRKLLTDFFDGAVQK